VRVILSLLLCILLCGCDTFGLGYVNELHRSIKIVEYGWGVAQAFTLKPGEIKPVGFGHVADRIDVLRPDGQLLAHYCTREIPRIGASRGNKCVVLRSSGVVIELKQHLAYNE